MSAASGVTLYGYRLSVYTRIVRMVLDAKAVPFDDIEVDPFSPGLSPSYQSLHPFKRVPALDHNGFVLYETAAITRYLDAVFPDIQLTPDAPDATARMAQVIQIVDSYAYWPLVRQVFAHGVIRPHEGLPGDAAQIAAGLTAAPPVLAALDRIAAEGLVLNARSLTLADCHLAPMIAAFTACPDGARLVAQTPALGVWWRWCCKTRSLRRTDCGFDRALAAGA